MTVNRDAFNQSPWLQPGFYIGVAMIFMLLFCIDRCSCRAKAATPQKKVCVCDTISASPECIDRYISKTTASGNEKIYAVYRDEKKNIMEIIPISQSVYEYLEVCREYKVSARIGIRVKNGKAIAIIKLPIYIKR